MEEYRFKVNLAGMIEILSDHLYSSPDVYIRELLQNGVDAITAREKRDADYKENREGRILITLQEGKSLTFQDNGVGLTKEEIHKFLAIIGQSSKKDIETGKVLTDYIGRFGIGLLSYFMVSDQIRLRTRSVDCDISYEWIGNPDGTYLLSEISEAAVGSEIYLEAKSGCEEYFTRETVERLILHYGLILPYPILLDDGTEKRRINPVQLPWANGEVNKQEIMMFGALVFGQNFMDCIILHSEQGGIDGVAYILPHTVQPSNRQNHRIYLKNMLLTEKGQNILPDWVFFTKCIINAQSLNPTASREGFYEDETLECAKEEIGVCISNYLKWMAKENPSMFHKFLEVHSLAVKSIAIENDELYRLFIDELEFVTTRGTMTGLELRLSQETLLYCGMEQYRQLSQVFLAQGKLLVNAGYVYTEELLRKMPEFFRVKVAPVVGDEIDDLLKDVSLADMELAVDFLQIARNALAPYRCAVEMKQFIPANLPAFYYINEEAKLFHEIQKVQEEADDMFSDMLSNFAQEVEETAQSVLYFNLRNPIVKKLLSMENVESLYDIIIILYVQTLLIGGFTLRNNELGMMNDKLLSLMEHLI